MALGGYPHGSILDKNVGKSVKNGCARSHLSPFMLSNGLAIDFGLEQMN